MKTTYELWNNHTGKGVVPELWARHHRLDRLEAIMASLEKTRFSYTDNFSILKCVECTTSESTELEGEVTNGR